MGIEQYHGAAQEQADVRLVGVADAAVQLDGLAGHQQSRFRGPYPCAGNLPLALAFRRPGIDRGGGLLDHGARQFDLDPQVDHAVLQRLETTDLAAELATYLEVLQGSLEGAIHQSDQIGRAGQRCLVQNLFRYLAGQPPCRRIAETQARQVSAILGRLADQFHAIGIALDQRQALLAGHQPGIGGTSQMYVSDFAVQPPLLHTRASPPIAVGDARRQDQPLSGQQRNALVFRQQRRHQPGLDQRLGQQAAPQRLQQRRVFAHAQAAAAQRFIQAQRRPAHGADLAPGLAVHPATGETTAAHAGQVAVAWHQRSRAVADHPQTLLALAGPLVLLTHLFALLSIRRPPVRHLHGRRRLVRAERPRRPWSGRATDGSAAAPPELRYGLAARYLKLPEAMAMTSPSSLQISAVQKQIVRVRRTTLPTARSSPRALPMKWVAMSMVTIEQSGRQARIAWAMAASSTDINTPPWNCCR